MGADIYAKERQILLNQFGTMLKRARHDKDVSQEELADRCGLHRTEISLLERGLRSPRLCTMVLLATELGIPLTALIARLPVPTARPGHAK